MTNNTVAAPVLGRIVHSTPDYVVRLETLIEPESKEELVVYAIVNRDTGVREAEHRGYIPAVQYSNAMQAAANKQREEASLEEALLEAMPTGEEGYIGEEVTIPEEPVDFASLLNDGQ